MSSFSSNEFSTPIISSSLFKKVRIIVDIIPSLPLPKITFSILSLNIFDNLSRKINPEASGYL